MNNISTAIRLGSKFFLCWVVEIVTLIGTSVKGIIAYPIPGKLVILGIYGFMIYEAFQNSGIFWILMGMLFLVTMILALMSMWIVRDEDKEE